MEYVLVRWGYHEGSVRVDTVARIVEVGQALVVESVVVVSRLQTK